MPPNVIVPLTFAIGLGLVAPSRSALGQAPELSPEQSQRAAAAARVAAGSSALDLIFPPVPFELLGCPGSYPSQNGGAQRAYQWHVTNEFRDSSYPQNHFMGIYVFFWLPDAVALSQERLDSALTTLKVRVEEFGGEPPMSFRQVQPISASARMVDGQLRVHLTGKGAVQAFRRPSRDRVRMGWCQRDVKLSHVELPIIRK